MSVTMEFFDGITFDIAKQKYYNANKVDARMEEIKFLCQSHPGSVPVTVKIQDEGR